MECLLEVANQFRVAALSEGDMERVKVMVSLFNQDGRCLVTHVVDDAGIGDLVSLMYVTWINRSLDAVSMNVNIEQKGLKK